MVSSIAAGEGDLAVDEAGDAADGERDALDAKAHVQAFDLGAQEGPQVLRVPRRAADLNRHGLRVGVHAFEGGVQSALA